MYWLEFYVWGDRMAGVKFRLPFRSEEDAADYAFEHRHSIRKHSLRPGGLNG